MPINYTRPTGEVFVRNFDEGVVTRLGGIIKTVQLPGIDERYGYFVQIPGIFNEDGNSVREIPIVFNNPEQIYENKFYPSFLISRDSMEQAMARWHSVKQVEYVAGVSGTYESRVVGGQTVSGYATVESKVQAYPYDIFYTISAYSRYEHEALLMLKQILRQFPPYSRIFVVDSLAEVRSYTVFATGTVSDVGEYVDVAQRIKAFSYAIRVEGELDLTDPKTQNTVASFNHSVSAF